MISNHRSQIINPWRNLLLPSRQETREEEDIALQGAVLRGRLITGKKIFKKEAITYDNQRQ
jgi:hypothetical protein